MRINPSVSHGVLKLRAMRAYHDAVADGDFDAACKIFQLLIHKTGKFYNDDASWSAERYLNHQKVHETYTDKNGYYSRIAI